MLQMAASAIYLYSNGAELPTRCRQKMGQLPYFDTLQVRALTIKPLENYIVCAAISKGIHAGANANMVV